METFGLSEELCPVHPYETSANLIASFLQGRSLEELVYLKLKLSYCASILHLKSCFIR